jgi:catechol 2,3-dioxygenase-like lactoylglutathione lyase family enzyme
MCRLEPHRRRANPGVSSIPAVDVEAAVAFYRDQLGFRLAFRDAEPAQFAVFLK